MRPAVSHARVLIACTLALAALTRTTRAASVTAAPSNNAKVPVDLFVMSKCPDAVFCERFLAPVLQELQQSVTLRAHFIGFKQDDGSWRCKHGKEECAGDVQQLCVQQNTKPCNSVKWLLSYMLCNNKHFDETGSFATATKCLKEANIPLSQSTKILGCMYGPTHQALLEADFDNTATLGITTSCTVQFDGKVVAVRDGGKWVRSPGAAEEHDFKAALCVAYAARNRGRLPPQCRDAPTASGGGSVSVSRH